jgi:phosphoadenosine phosphosulfate reductase
VTFLHLLIHRFDFGCFTAQLRKSRKCQRGLCVMQTMHPKGGGLLMGILASSISCARLAVRSPLSKLRFTQRPDPTALAATLAAQFPRLDLGQRLAAVRSAIRGRIVFTTSFGIEDQAIAHAIFTQNLAVDVVTLDTGRLFPQTYALWAETERRHGRRIRGYYPDRHGLERLVGRQGVNGFYTSLDARHDCCAVRKVEPLGRVLAGAAAWITGLRADQSMERARMSYATVDPRYRLIKVNPLFDWTRERVVAFIHDQRIPCNPLHERGFLSIGCAPCTRAIAPSEPERAGRWWWEQESKKECGLHARQRDFARDSEPAQSRS